MGTGHGPAAIGAATPLLAPDPVATPRDAATPALPLPAAATIAATAELAELSVTGKLLAALLQSSPSTDAMPGSPAALLPEATAQAPAIARAISKGIEHSGLFYESHLADWVTGQRNLESLKHEPQANTGSADEVTAILKQQLEMLDKQPLEWRGELWPGMPVQIRIRRDAHAAPGGGEPGDSAHSWSSTLVSKLPSLGTVTAKIRIDGDRLQLGLQSADADKLLAERASELRQALALCGLRLQRFDANGESDDERVT